MFKPHRPGRARLVIPWFLGIMAVFSLGASDLAGQPNEMCADCHEEVVEAFAATPHGTYFSGGSNGCQSCHGAGLDHIEAGGDPDLIINPANASQFESDLLCLNCHKDPQFDEWHFSAHSGAGLNCSQCHSVHVEFGHTMKAATPTLCYDCHSEVRAATSMPSHHPIAEGEIDCQDCHGIHGGSGRLTQDASGNELCFTCHADKEGPFIYEHAPVNEDCGYCHTPHGSVADKLLTQSEPALCLNCHPMHFHASVEAVDGDWPAVNADLTRSGTSTAESWKEAMLTKCTQCHNEVHGSDSHGQAISSGGGSLTR